MDIGIIIALCVAVTLTLVSGIAAGLFGGMWWQAQKTAEVWEKTYTHLREQLSIKHDTYNTRGDGVRDARTWLPPEDAQTTVQPQPVERGRLRVQAATAPPPPPPVTPSLEAMRFGGKDTRFEPAEDPDADEHEHPWDRR